MPVPDLTTISTPTGVFHTVAGDMISDQLTSFGAHTRNELAMVLAHVDPSDVCVDLGAHIGTFAIPISRKLGREGRVLAVEGDEETFALLQANVAENGLTQKIETVQAIVGHGPQRSVRRVEVEGNTGAGYYLADDKADLAAVDAYALLCMKGFGSPNFIKIDIEGMELLVLQSLEPLIAAHRPKLYIEMVERQLARFGTTCAGLQDFLARFDYRFFRNTGERNSDNDLFVKTELHCLEEGGEFFDLLALPA